MNILWTAENVIINFYIRKWRRNIKQTALNIKHGSHVKKVASRIIGKLTEQWAELNRRSLSIVLAIWAFSKRWKGQVTVSN